MAKAVDGRARRVPRERLNRGQVVTVAMALADERGIESLTMRNLGQELGVVPMALYKHVANKAELLDLMVDQVIGEIEFDVEQGWKAALRQRALSMRDTLQRHPWAIGLTEAGTYGPIRLEHHEALLRCLRQDAGLPFAMALHAFSLIDSLVYGFALQQKALVGRLPEDTSVHKVTQQPPSENDKYPYVTELLTHLGEFGYDYREEFRFGLEAVLDTIERLRDGELEITSLASASAG